MGSRGEKAMANESSDNRLAGAMRNYPFLKICVDLIDGKTVYEWTYDPGKDKELYLSLAHYNAAKSRRRVEKEDSGMSEHLWILEGAADRRFGAREEETASAHIG